MGVAPALAVRHTPDSNICFIHDYVIIAFKLRVVTTTTKRGMCYVPS
jgi:hypothetical protein